MAISLGFGILFAPAITLVLVPVNILIGNDLAHLARRMWRRTTGSAVAADPGLPAD